ncbi:MAG: hypothetical protein ABFS35_02510 [Bacteroidota bacterium]
MGLTIHYQGSLNSKEKITQLVNELEDISKDMGWDYTLIEKYKEDKDTVPPLYGIVMTTAKGCEMLSFIFDEDGNLRHPVALQYFDYDDKNQLYVATKTQYATPEDHIVIIKLLRYIKKVYITNLKVIDEGEYWQSSDKERLVYLFNFLKEKIEQVANIIENSGELAEVKNNDELIEKLDELINLRLNHVESLKVVNKKKK